jgi:ligand-binding SRPBCC domain-containing protein
MIPGKRFAEQNKPTVVMMAMSKVYSFKTVQKMPMSLDKAWEFFSNPANLANITPDNMGFKTISKYHGDTMYAGQVIEYRVSPVLGIPLYWMTEITHVDDKKYFVDEQRYGPYSMWHHQHHFKAIEGGVEMTDIVHYKLPLWFLGDIANTLFVNKQLNGIFDYRFKKVEELFGKIV